MKVLHDVLDVHRAALRALRDSHLREVYIGFCAEDTAVFAVPDLLVENFVHATEEHDSFDRDLQLLDQTTARFDNLQKPLERPVDLEPESRSKFPKKLGGATCPVEIDLD